MIIVIIITFTNQNGALGSQNGRLDGQKPLLWRVSFRPYTDSLAAIQQTTWLQRVADSISCGLFNSLLRGDKCRSLSIL